MLVRSDTRKATILLLRFCQKKVYLVTLVSKKVILKPSANRTPGPCDWPASHRIYTCFWVEKVRCTWFCLLCVRWQGGDRVSPCRSAYFASPWRLLTLTSEDVGEKQLYCSLSRDGIWRCGALARLISWLSRIQNAILIIRKRINYLFLR